jgi:hypothetical protein
VPEVPDEPLVPATPLTPARLIVQDAANVVPKL